MTVKAAVNSFPAPTRHQLVAEGNYLIATSVGVPSGALGTGVTWPAATTAFSDTGPVGFYIVNNEGAAGKSLFLDYLKLISTAVQTTATSVCYGIIVDSTPRTVSTDHTSVVTPVNPNSEASNVAAPTIKVQNSATASVFTASSASARTVATGVLGGINIARHVYRLSFGDISLGLGGGITDAAGAPAQSGDASAPVIVAPGHCCTIAIWAPGSAASMAPEFELGMFFR